jgi:hypothetical protein
MKSGEQGVQMGRSNPPINHLESFMFKNIGTDRDFILSLESGRVMVRAVTQKSQLNIDSIRVEAAKTGLVIGNSSPAAFFVCHSQFDEPIAVIKAIKEGLEADGYSVALPKYEMEKLQEKPSTGEEAISIICAAE